MNSASPSLRPEERAPASYRIPFGVRLALACVPALIGAIYFATSDTTPADLLQRLGAIPPWVTFLLIALTPLAGFPLAPLYAYAGLTHGPVEGYAISLAGVAVNLAIAHPVYGALLRRPVTALLKKNGWDPARLHGAHRLKITFLVAAVPALPFWAQNAVLAAGGIPFRLYFLVSFGVQMLFALAGVALGWLGRDASESTPLLILVLAGIPVSILIINRIRKPVLRDIPGVAPADE